ncbi:MAG: hypothetical protein WBZ37_08270 [Mycobacterium sp.]
MPYNSNDVDPNLAQFLYRAPHGVYNSFVQADSGLRKVGPMLFYSLPPGVSALPTNTTGCWDAGFRMTRVVETASPFSVVEAIAI